MHPVQSEDVVGVVVARLQVDDPHPGHDFTISYAFERHTNVMVILGVPSGYPDRRNPLSFELREMMLRKKYAGAGVPLVIVSQKSRRQGNDVRSAHIDRLVEEQFPGRKAIIYGARDSIVDTYEGKFETERVPTVFSSSATVLRENIQPRNTPDFRAGVIWAHMQRPPIAYPTVDIALLEGDRIWLGRKKAETKFRFPGGFYDIAIDASLEDAANRELHEEMEDEEIEKIVTSHPIIIGSCRIDDWRYRRSPDGIITTLTKAQLICGEPRAHDDLDEVRSFPITKHVEHLMPEHVPLGKILLKHLYLL